MYCYSSNNDKLYLILKDYIKINLYDYLNKDKLWKNMMNLLDLRLLL